MIDRRQATERITNPRSPGTGYRYNNFHAPYPGIPDRCVKMRRNGATRYVGEKFQIPVKQGIYAGVITSDMATDKDSGLFIADECPRCHPARNN